MARVDTEAKWDLASKTQLVNALAILLPIASVKFGWVTQENITAILQVLDMSQTQLIYLGGTIISLLNIGLRKLTVGKTSIWPKWLRQKWAVSNDTNLDT